MTVQDDGGTADGGQDTSIKTFTITITESQDPPSSTPGLDITVDDPPVAVDDNSDAGAENAGDSSTPIADDGAAVHLLSAPSSALGSVMAASTYPLIEQWDHDHAYSAQKTLAAGQNFRYREKLRLTKIALFLYTNDPTSARLVVQRGPFDSGTVVASATVDVDQCVKYYWYEFELEPQPVFAADEIFSILLYREGDADFKYAIALDSNPYEGTDLYHGQQTSLSNWDPWVDSDMAFKVWGEKLNEAPTVMNNGLTLLEGGTATITSAHLRADDADNPPASTLKFKVTASPRNGSLWRDGYYLSSNTFTQADLDGGLLVYKNSVTGQTSDSFKFTLTDGKVTLPEHTFDITIILVNEAPSFSLQKTSLWVQEDSGPQSYSDFAMNISAGQNESDQTVWFEVTADKPELFTDQPAIDANGTLTFTPAPDANGKARVTVQAFDNGGTDNGGINRSAEKSFDLYITAVNDPPIPVDDIAETIQEDSGEVKIGFDPASNDKPGPPTAIDEADQRLYVTEVSNGFGGTVRRTIDNIYFTPEPDFHGDAYFWYTVKDSWGGYAEGGKVTVPVSPVADKPTASGGEVFENGEITLSVQRSPVDGSEVTHFTFGGAEHGRLYRADGETEIMGGFIPVDEVSTVIFKPDPDFTGVASFTVRAATDGEGSGLSEETLVQINVIPSNIAPVAADDELGPFPDARAPIVIPFDDLLANDSPGLGEESQTLTITAVGSPVGGTVRIEGTNVIFTVSPGYNARASFVYTVADDGTPSMTDTAVVSFDVTYLFKPPIATGTTTAEDTLSNHGLVIKPDPEDGDSVQFLIENITDGTLYKNDGVTQIKEGDLITVDEGGAGLRFMPLPDQNGDHFGFTVHAVLDADRSGMSPGTDVEITVTEVNDSPVAEDDDLKDEELKAFEDEGPWTIPISRLIANDTPGPANESHQRLSVTDVSPVQGGTVEIVGEAVVFTPAENFAGKAEFTYTVADNGTTNGVLDPHEHTATVTFPITPVNDPPSFTKGSDIEAREDDGAQSVPGWAKDIKAGPADEDDRGLEFLVTNDNTALFTGDGQPAIDAKTGTLTFTLAENAWGSAAVTVVLTDNGGGEDKSGPVTFTITVHPVNDPPIALPDSEANPGWMEDGGEFKLTIDPLDNDEPGPAEHGQEMKIVGVSNGVHVTVRLAEDGSIYFTPPKNWHGTDTFTYTVEDSEGAKSQATITVAVESVADAPTTTSKTVEVNTTASGLIIGRNSVDEVAEGEAGAVTHFKVEWTESLRGTLALSGGTPVISGEWYAFDADGRKELRFTPSPDAYGVFNFTVTAATSQTGAGAGEPTTFTVTVNPPLEAPAVSEAAIATPEDTMTGLVGIMTHERDRERVTHYIITDIQGGTLLKSDGITAIEGAVIPVVEGAAAVRFKPSHDLNSDTGGTFQFTVAAALDAAGTGMSSGTTVKITVIAVNDPPSFTPGGDQTVDEDAGPQSVEAWATNIKAGPDNEDGQILTFEVIENSNPDLFSVQPKIDAGGTLTFEPAKDANGSAEITVVLMDDGGTDYGGGNRSSAKTFTITVNPINDAPIATPDEEANDNWVEDGGEFQLTIDPLKNDEPGPANEFGQTLKIVGVSNGAHVTVRLAEDGSIYFNPPKNWHGTDTLTYEVEDSEGAKSQSTITVAVKSVADAPTTTSKTIDEDTTASGLIIGRSSVDEVAEGEAGAVTHFKVEWTESLRGTLALSGGMPVISGEWYAFDADGRKELRFTPAPDAYGVFTFTVTAATSQTGAGAGDPTTFTVVVSPVAEAPIVSPISTLEDTTTEPITMTPDERDKGMVTHYFITGIEGGTLLESDGITEIGEGAVIPVVEGSATVRFKPSHDLNSDTRGTFQFTAAAALDAAGTGMSSGTTVKITVIAVNDPPSFTPGGDQTVEEDAGPQSVEAWATNMKAGPDNEGGQILTFEVIGNSNPDLFSVQPKIDAGGTLTFEPAKDANGSAEITVVLMDDGGTDYGGSNRSGAATFTITVNPVNDPPIAEDQSLTVTAGGTLRGTVKVTDVDGDSLTYEVVDPPEHGTVHINPDGSFTFTSSRSGQDSFTFKAYDSTAYSNVARVTVQVNPKSGGRPGGSSGRPNQPAEPAQPAEPTASEPPTGGSDGEMPEGSPAESAPPVHQEVDAGQPAEAKVLNFQVNLPGDAAPEPLRLQVVSPTANTDAVKLAEGAAEFAGTGDGELTRRADGTSVSKVRATVTFEYDPQVVSNPAELRIFYFDTKQNVWVEIGGEVNSQTNTIAVQVGHFTTFAALVPRADAPVLPELPASVELDKLTVSGTAPAGAPVTLVINGDAQATVMTDENGRYTLEGTLAEGQNWVYVKGTGALASREWPVSYRPSESYTDIGGHWAEETVTRLAELGIAVYAAPLFEPETKVTRLEFAVMVARVLGLAPMEEALAFTDTHLMPEWFRAEVASAHQAGIIKGMPDGSFAPDRLVSRAEMAVMLTRALAYAGKDITPGDHRFADAADINDWAQDHVHAATRWGLITGYPDDTFRPFSDTTRAEAVTMLGRLLDLVSE